jgi:hypothetical protein
MRSLPSLFKHTQSNDLTAWQFALLKSIQLRPSLWIDGHRDVEALRRRGLVFTYERYLLLTDTGVQLLRRASASDSFPLDPMVGQTAKACRVIPFESRKVADR